eukprot:8583196-Alexandrium_andersonii.AAC.1
MHVEADSAVSGPAAAVAPAIPAAERPPEAAPWPALSGVVGGAAATAAAIAKHVPGAGGATATRPLAP